MKKIIIVLFVILFANLISSCSGGSGYAGYKTTYVEDYQSGILVRAGGPATIITCEGPGIECEIGGPHDGQVFYWRVTSTIYDTVYTSDTKKQLYINEISAAYNGNYINSLITNPEYDFLFRKSANRNILVNKLNDKSYKMSKLSNNGFIVYDGHILNNPENIYQTIIITDQ